MTKSPGLILLVTMMSAGAYAQPVISPAITATIASQRAAIIDQQSAVKADVSTARDTQRSTAATREQIQAIRSALKARLATLHH